VIGVAFLIAGGWLLAIVAQVTGNAGLLHHHSLIEGGLPLWFGAAAFVLSWQVMIAAMMLPASVPAMRVMGVASARRAGRSTGGATFLGAFALVWTLFGLAAFGGDAILHRIVDVTPWLAARPWLIEGGVLAIAGLYQLTPLKERSLAECRHPVSRLDPHGSGSSALSLGLEHGLACIGSSWALMLLMFAEGFANLGWMAVLTGLMAYETIGRRGPTLAWVAGLGLLQLAGFVVARGLLAF